MMNFLAAKTGGNPPSKPQLAALALLLGLASAGCSGAGGGQGSESALADCSAFAKSLSQKRSATVGQLAQIAREWRTLDAKAMPLDTAEASLYMEISQTVSESFDRLVDSRPRSLSDYVVFAKEICLAEADTSMLLLAEPIRRFYDSADSLPAWRTSAKATVSAYGKILSEALSGGFQSRSQVYGFLKEEDQAFRSFLTKLPLLDGFDLSGIRDATSAVMGRILALAAGEEALLPTEEAVALMTMRTNRRLIQNAEACTAGLRERIALSDGYETAYGWMLMQPWTSFDAFAFSLMDAGQWESLASLAVQTPALIGGIEGFPASMEELPSVLMKLLFSSL